jgi:Nitronate monooxygenase
VRTALCERLGIVHPVLQAPIGGAAGPSLAAAVSNAGGLGAVSLTGFGAEGVRGRIQDLRRRTDRPFVGNFILAFDVAEEFEAALAERVPVISLFWGDPTPLVAPAHDAGALLMVTVGSVAEAMQAAEAGVDILADVVAVDATALPGVRRRHRCAARPEDQPLQQCRRLRAGACRSGAGVLGKDRVHLVPQVLLDDRRVLARIHCALVDGEPEVRAVAEAIVEVAFVDRAALGGQDTLPATPEPAPSPSPREGTARTLSAPLTRRARARRAFGPSRRSRAARCRPSTCLLARRPDFVANPLGDDLALELGEGEHDVQGQPPRRGRRVEALGDRG